MSPLRLVSRTRNKEAALPRVQKVARVDRAVVTRDTAGHVCRRAAVLARRAHAQQSEREDEAQQVGSNGVCAHRPNARVQLRASSNQSGVAASKGRPSAATIR